MANLVTTCDVIPCDVIPCDVGSAPRADRCRVCFTNTLRIILSIGVMLLLFCAQSFLGFASTTALNKRHSLISSSAHSYQIAFPQNKKLLLIIFDFNDFMCMSCLESFLTFCQLLPPHILEENAWGILTIESAIKKSGLKDSVKIATTKLRGFVTANSIKFPIFIDEYQIFQQFEKKGTAVLLFDGTNNILKEYIFPLNKNQIGEIQKIVSGF